ncbi:MAG: orotidine-5'-phosphate decarboxylase [Phycisphaerales bacterium]
MPPAATHAADRLLAAIERLGAPVCVGLDPVLEKIPSAVRSASISPVDAIEKFSRGVIDAIAATVPCVKPQSACFERHGSAGVAALERTIAHAKARGLEVILDAKRGDIGVSAEHYAEAAFGCADSVGADWITINSYLGDDGMRPFLRPGRGAFALVRTSNPGGDALQSQRLADGTTVADAVARLVAGIGESSIGARGFSSLGAVVGATKRDDTARLRALMPRQVFLVPGYGAQGARLEDVLPCFHPDGRGAIVTASRAVIYAAPDATEWTAAVRSAAEKLCAQLRAGLGLGAR